MWSWFKRKASSAQPPPVREAIYRWAPDEIPRYPPFMKGLPSVAPDKLLETQGEMLEGIVNTAIAAPQVFERLYLPTIERFASFAHLLPASQSHHHRGAGGLLRHSIEVGLWALQSADKVLLDAARTPSKRREMESRWQLAVFLAALCHDAGKPVTDLAVTDRDRTAIWKPIKEDLYTWASRCGIDAYFLDWREGRSRQHTALANLIADRMIGTEALEWIGEGDTELIVWLMESLNCNPGPTNPIYDLVLKADQTSVERDLKTLGVAMAGYDLGVPVERHLTDVMRRFIKEGAWLVNQPGARLWNIAGNLYLVWPAAGEEIARQVREDGIPGIPRTPDGILDMLVERQIAFVRDGEAPGERLWKIAPACLAEKIPDIRLPAIRLRDEAMVSSIPIPPIDGRIVDDEESRPQTVAVKEAPQSVDRQRGGHSAPAVEAGLEQAQQEPPTTVEEPEEPSTGTKNTQAAALPDPRPRSATERKVLAILLNGPVGEALKALAQDLRTGDKRWGVDAMVDAGGQVMLRWPDAFSGYGLTAKGILDELVGRDWLWIDPMAPLKKVLDAEIGGRQVKVIRLEHEIGDALIGEVGEIARSDTNQGETPSPLMRPQDSGAERIEDDRNEGHPKRERRQATTPKGAGRLSMDEAQATKHVPPSDRDADRPLGSALGGRDTREGPFGASAQPSLDEVMAVLGELPAAAQPDGWCVLSKPEAMTACKKRGLKLTHGWLARLAQEDHDRFIVEGAIVKYRA